MHRRAANESGSSILRRLLGYLPRTETFVNRENHTSQAIRFPGASSAVGQDMYR